MSFVESLRRTHNTLSELGLTELITWAPEYLSEVVRHYCDDFDRRYGTDTNGSVPVARLEGVGSYQSSAQLYWPVRESSFREMISAIDLPLNEVTFVDVGCGKGRGLLLALNWPFRAIVGVEFSPELCSAAEQNLYLVGGGDGDVACQDATEFEFPLTDLLLFLFDPFGPQVLVPFVERLVDSLRRHPRRCVIAYYLPMHQKIFEDWGFTVIAENPRSWRMTYPWTVLESTVL